MLVSEELLAGLQRSYFDHTTGFYMVSVLLMLVVAGVMVMLEHRLLKVYLVGPCTVARSPHGGLHPVGGH